MKTKPRFYLIPLIFLIAFGALGLQRQSGFVSNLSFTYVPLSAQSPTLGSQTGPGAAETHRSFRFQRDGWIYVHLEGKPGEIGYQHGYRRASKTRCGR